MNAWRMSIWCWVIFVIGMVGLVPAMAGGLPAVGAEQVVSWAAFGYAMYVSLVVVRGGDKRLVKRGAAGSAKVLSAKQTNTVVQEGEFAWEAPYVWKYGLEVTVAGRAPYETMLYICAHLSAGETVPVRVSKLNRKRVTIDRSEYDKQYQEKLRLAGQSRSGRSGRSGRVVVASGQQPASAMSHLASTSPVAELDIADELSKLAALRAQGILTDAEFAVQKAKLLSA
jgi:hypothetical protein